MTMSEWFWWGRDETSIFMRDAPWFLILAMGLIWNLACCHMGMGMNIWTALMTFFIIEAAWMITQKDEYTMYNFWLSFGSMAILLVTWWWFFGRI